MEESILVTKIKHPELATIAQLLNKSRGKPDICVALLRGDKATMDGEASVFYSLQNLVAKRHKAYIRNLYLCEGAISIPERWRAIGKPTDDLIQVGGLVSTCPEFLDKVFRQLDEDLEEIVSWNIPILLWMDEKALERFYRRSIKSKQYIVPGEP
jgi:hypothetical protein